MSSLYNMNSNRICCLTCLYIAAVLTDPCLKASMGFPYVRQTTRTFQHVNNIGAHAGKMILNLCPVWGVVGKLVALIREAALSILAAFVITPLKFPFSLVGNQI